MIASERSWTAPSDWQPNPEYWYARDPYSAEREVSELVAAFVRALQPEIVLETGTCMGWTSEAIGKALRANGHGFLYSLEISGHLCSKAAERCAGLPVEIVQTDSMEWTPPGKIGFAWLDSDTDIRHLELQRFMSWFEPGSVVGIHDTAPHFPTYNYLRPFIAEGLLNPITLRTPRGVTFGTVNTNV